MTISDFHNYSHLLFCWLLGAASEVGCERRARGGRTGEGGDFWWTNHFVKKQTVEFGGNNLGHLNLVSLSLIMYIHIYIYKRLKWGFDFAEIQIVARNGTIRWKTSKTECDFRAKQYGNLSLIHN